jgi:hypothetical protein
MHNEELHNLNFLPRVIRMIVKENGMGKDMEHEWGKVRYIYDIGGKARKKETTRKIKT